MKINLYPIKFLVFLTVLTSVTRTYGQMAQVSSPNATSFAVFDQYPQTSFTGVPSINIPIYDFEYNGMSLPITLRYNNNLVRPYTLEGWVGLGWNLTAGGVVNRVVNGKPDDRNWFNVSDYGATQKTDMGYFYNHSTLSGSDWNTQTKIYNSILDEPNLPLKDPDGSAHSGQLLKPDVIYDYAPDEFSFSVGDLSGTFYMDDQGKWRVRSKNHVQILVSSADMGSKAAANTSYTYMTFANYTYFTRITIKDDRGITYVFGNNGTTNSDNSLEWSYSADVRDSYIKSWNLTSITFPNGKTISYSYQQNNLTISAINRWSSDLQVVTGVDEHCTASFLTNIHTDQLDINFTAVPNSTKGPKLSGIKVIDNTTNQAIFNSLFTYVTDQNGRLTLYNYAQLDRTNKIGPQYYFTYNAEHYSSQIYNSDHWGFYTSTPFNYNSFDALEGSSRSADTVDCRAELLDRIVYPEGGYSIYTWEPNDVSKIAYQDPSITLTSYTRNISVGGTRIKQITNFDSNGARIGAKRYNYNHSYSPTNQNGLSSGILHGEPYYYTFQQNDPNSSHLNTTDVSLASNTPLTDNNSGSHVGYSETAEINDDGSYSTTFYTNFDTGSEFMDIAAEASNKGDIDIAHAPSVTSMGYKRGLPRVTRLYSNTMLVKETDYQYMEVDKDSNSDSNSVRAIMGNVYDYLYDFFYGNSDWIWSGYSVRFYTSAYLPQYITETVYNQPTSTEPVSTLTTYTYDLFTLNPTSISRSDSKGQTIKTKYRYVTDLLSGLSVPSNASQINYPYSFMLNHNMTSIPIETVQSVVKNGTEQITDVKVTKYQGLTGTLAAVVPSADYQSAYNGLRTSYTPYTISIDGTGEHQSTIDAYLKPVLNYTNWDNTTGNLTQFTKNSESPTSIKWGYQNTLKIAECKNATADEYFYEGFEDQPSTYARLEQYGGHTGRNCVTSFYNVTWTPPSGSTRIFYISYWYRSSGTWHYQPEQVYTGGITLSGYDAYDDIRIYPAGAQMNTYTYVPFVGVSSMTDAKGMTTFYEYDNFNRLRTIKDNQRNIIKAYCYNYKGEVSNCLVPQANPWPSIYAKIVMSDQGTGYTADAGGSGYVYEQRATFTVKFYSDEACTIPYTLPTDMLVYVVDTYQTFDEIQGITSSTDYTNILLAYGGQNSMMIGTQSMPYADTHFHDGTYDGVQDIYKLIPNPTNTYVIK